MEIGIYIRVEGVGTENDVVLGGFAGESAGAVIEGIAIGSGTSPLEDGGVIGGSACGRVRKMPDATVLLRPECLTRALAPHHPVPTRPHHLQLFWASCATTRRTKLKIFDILEIKLRKLNIYLC